MRILLAIDIILFAACAVCCADSVSLKIGATLQGEILQDDLEGVRIRLTSNVEKFYKREEVIAVERERPAALMEADKLFSDGKIKKAVERYEEVVKIGKNNWVKEQGRLRLIQCYLSLGKLKKSVETYIEILKANPKTLSFIYIPIVESEDEGKDEALAYLNEVIAHPPAAPNVAQASEPEQFIKDVARLLVADILMAQGKSDEIEPDLKYALEKQEPLQVSSDERIASFIKVHSVRLAFTLRRYDKAIDYAQRSLRTLNNSFLPELYYWLGRSYFDAGAPKRALVALLRVPIFYGEFEELASRCLYVSAQAFERLEQWEQAKRIYKELVEKYPCSVCARKVGQAGSIGIR